jgi:hypothetical protein
MLTKTALGGNLKPLGLFLSGDQPISNPNLPSLLTSFFSDPFTLTLLTGLNAPSSKDEIKPVTLATFSFGPWL